MSLAPPTIAEWCRKVRPLVLWEDRTGFDNLLGSTDGHNELIRLANIYRASHTFWPSLPNLVEQVLGPPTAAARALRRQQEPEPADPGLADWGEAPQVPDQVRKALRISSKQKQA